MDSVDVPNIPTDLEGPVVERGRRVYDLSRIVGPAFFACHGVECLDGTNETTEVTTAVDDDGEGRHSPRSALRQGILVRFGVEFSLYRAGRRVDEEDGLVLTDVVDRSVDDVGR